MVLLNLWSLGHFVQWAFLGRYLLRNWYVFLALDRVGTSGTLPSV